MAEQALARITPLQRASVAPTPHIEAEVIAKPQRRDLTSRQKAAVIVRYLLSEGASLQLTQLPDVLQASLAEQMGAMRLVDRATLQNILDEFTEELAAVGLAFPGGIEGALTAMDGHISASAASRLRRLAGMASKADPWERLVTLSADVLQPIIENEAIEVAAVIMSKLPVPCAAELLDKISTDKARAIAFAVSQTGNIDPETVRRIGNAVLQQVDSRPARAFDRGPVERVGAILDNSAPATRDAVLRGLEAEDSAFADQVKRAIFTWQHIPHRVSAADVPKLLRALDRSILISVFAWVKNRPADEAVSEYFYQNLPQRLAQVLKEEAAERGRVKDSEGDEAMRQIIDTIRQLEKDGELILLLPEG